MHSDSILSVINEIFIEPSQQERSDIDEEVSRCNGSCAPNTCFGSL